MYQTLGLRFVTIDILLARNSDAHGPAIHSKEIVINNKLHEAFPSEDLISAYDNTDALELLIDNLYRGCDDHIASDTDNLDSLPFAKYGFVCRRLVSGPKNNLDPENFNINARCLEWVGLSSKNDQGLAFYVLSQFTTHSGVSKNTECDLLCSDCCNRFTDEVLNDIPKAGGQIPFSVICRWLARKQHGI